MLLASGANFGFRRSIPHMLGIGLGVMLMIVLVGLGLIQVFEMFPVSYTILKVLSVGYLLYLAWKIARAAPPNDVALSGSPFSFLQAALFQWVNPKAWVMALTAISVYAPSQSISAIFLIALVFGLTNLPAISIWAVMGREMRRVLNNPKHLRSFNIVMAILLLASLYPVLFP